MFFNFFELQTLYQSDWHGYVPELQTMVIKEYYCFILQQSFICLIIKCSFVAIVRSGIKQAANKFRQVSSFLLLLLFCSVALLTAFHDHENDPQSVVVKGQDSIGLQDSCLVCAYLVHHHDEYALLSYPQVVIRPAFADLPFRANGAAWELSAVFQTLINKGPPLLF